MPTPLPPPAPASPADLFRHGLQLLLAKDVAAWTDLWAEDGIMEFPFAPPDRPDRLDGRPAIAAYMRHYPDHIDLTGFPDLRIHRTTDEDTIVVEKRAVGRLVQTGRPFDMTYIVVATVRDGLFVSYRDYWNPLILLETGAEFAGSAR